MSETDFVTALARLLCDPAQREAFARDPAAVAALFGVREADRPAFERLAPDEVEMQARVLVRKRFREAAALLPATCAALGAAAWTLFREHARGVWPPSASADALAFCDWLRERGEQVSAREVNRLRFTAQGRRFALRVVRSSSPRALPEFQLLFQRRTRVAEWSLRLGW